MFNATEENFYISLKEIHKKITNPLCKNEELQLVGSVNYHGKSGLPTRHAEESLQSVTGHYTAVIYRKGDPTTNWIEFDDLKNHSINRKENYKIVPRLLMHIKEIK